MKNLLFLIVCLPLQSFAADLSWDKPATNVDGSAVTDLAGYVITYTPIGQTIADAGTTVDIDDPNATTASLPDVDAGTHYFLIQSVNEQGAIGPYATQTGWPIPPMAPMPGSNITIIINQ